MILVGKYGDAYVYARKEDTFRPLFVDRLSYLLGKTRRAEVQADWWMERNGKRVEPLGDRAIVGYDLIVSTPFEVLKTRSTIVPLYTGYHLGRLFEVNGSCIVEKNYEGALVPLLLEGNAILDPDARIVCQPCPASELVTVTVLDENGRPLKGFFSTGNTGSYDFFGEFNGVIKVCKNRRLKVYVSGYRPWSGTILRNTIIKLARLADGVRLKAGFIYLDLTGALVDLGKDFVAPPGAYVAFHRFPLLKADEGRRVFEFNKPVWYGTQETATVPEYSIVRKGPYYYYVLDGDLLPLKGFICNEDFCVKPGGDVPLVAFGACTSEWNGTLISSCPILEVNTYKLLKR